MRQHFPEESNYSPCIVVQGNQKINQHKSMKKITDLIGNVNIPGIEKLFRIMKLTSFFLLISVVSVLAGKTYSQTKLLTLTFEKASVKEVLSKIEDQSEFYFMYSEKIIDVNREVSINVENQKIETVLNSIFTGTEVNYTVKDRIIVLTTPEVFDNTAQVAFQQKSVSGKVTDTQNQTLPGVTVVVKGTTQGTVTNGDGDYTITNVPDNATLVFSFVGMRLQEMVVGNQTRIDIRMEEETIGLEEVVAIGYGTQLRRSVTSSVSSVDIADAAKTTSSSIAQNLSGRAAGLTASVFSAQPGGAVSLQIRGSATGRSPLIVIDGMPTSDFSPSTVGRFGTGQLDAILSSLNPNDIESIDILKDASATSIYGSKAAGGVILITTKSGKAKGPDTFTVDFTGSAGVQEYFNLPEMLTPVEYMQETNKVRYEDFLYNSRQNVYANVPKPANWRAPSPYLPYYSDAQINEFISGSKTGTDWLDLITRTGSVQDYNLTVTGNQNNAQFLVSFSAFDQKGIVKNNDLSKYTGRVNVDQKFGEKVSAGVKINFSQINSDNVSIGNGNLWENAGIVLSALQFDPTLPIRDEKGNYHPNTRQSNFHNPASILELSNLTRMERLMSTVNLNYKILPELSLRFQTGFDRNQSENYHYNPTSTISGKSVEGRADRSGNENTNYQLQFLVNYIKTILQNHNLSGTLGSEYMKYTSERLNVTATNFPYDGALWWNLGLGADRPSVSSYGDNSELLSYFLRVSYDYDFKYFLTANFRIDGSSKFAPDNQYAFFPGISIGWDMARESFMTSSVINQMKFRAGFGITGNDNIGTAFTNWYSPGANTMWGSNIISGVRLAGFGNPNLTWEKQKDINFGLDFGIYNNRIYGSIDIFDREISRILGNKALVSFNPITTISSNLEAKKQTYGAELTLNSRNIQLPDFSWNSTLTFTYYRDRWLERDPSYTLGIYEIEKQFFGELWHRKSDGLVQLDTNDPLNLVPGTVKILDMDGYLLDANGIRILDANGKPQYSGQPDGKIDDADLVLVGVNQPFTVGFSNVINFKRFDLSVFTYGMFNRWKTNDTKNLLGGGSVHSIVSPSVNLERGALKRWNSDYQEGKEPSSSQTFAQYGVGDFFLEKAWFVRVRNITLGYTIPRTNLDKVKIRQLRLFGDITNPFIFTPYSGMDAETDAWVGAYPNQRTYMIGLELNF